MKNKYLLFVLSTLAIACNSCIHEQANTLPNTGLLHCKPKPRAKLTSDHKPLNQDLPKSDQICSKSHELDLIYEEDLAWY